MKKLFFGLCMLPCLAYGFGVELGLNDGNTFNASASLRFFRCFKVGVQYAKASQEAIGIFGPDSHQVLTSTSVIADYYYHFRKHELNGGVEVGRLNLSSRIDVLNAPTYNYSGYQKGAHFGYSYRIYKGFYINGSMAATWFNVSRSEQMGGSYSTETYSSSNIWLTIGVHYVFRVN